MARDRSENKIAIIGSGHIATALATGLIRSAISSRRLIVSGPSAPSSQTFKTIGVRTVLKNSEAVRGARWVFIAVKPSVVPRVLEEISEVLKNQIVISLAAGIRFRTLQRMLPASHVGRVIPNIPISVNQGIAGYFRGSLEKKEESELTRLLSGLGLVIPARSENYLDAITLLSGCGPGIVAFLIAMFAKNAEHLGLSKKAADMLAYQTFSGTLLSLVQSGLSPNELMRSVATKGGVTESILVNLSKRGFTKDFTAALRVGYARIKKLQR